MPYKNKKLDMVRSSDDSPPKGGMDQNGFGPLPPTKVWTYYHKSFAVAEAEVFFYFEHLNQFIFLMSDNLRLIFFYFVVFYSWYFIS